MTKNETEVLRISRLLTPQHRACLLDRVRLACREEQTPGKGRAEIRTRGHRPPKGEKDRDPGDSPLPCGL